jgi:ABC-type Na+ efflux pump permease subunit
MFKIWVVIRREFLARERTKWFVVVTVLGPVLMAAMIMLPMLISTSAGGERTVVVVDATSSNFGERIAAILNEPTVPITATRAAVTGLELEGLADSLATAVGEFELLAGKVLGAAQLACFNS